MLVVAVAVFPGSFRGVTSCELWMISDAENFKMVQIHSLDLKSGGLGHSKTSHRGLVVVVPLQASQVYLSGIFTVIRHAGIMACAFCGRSTV